MAVLLHDLLLGSLDRQSGISLQRQIYEGIREAILQGHLPVDARMPSTRALAEHLKISRVTTSLVYERLTTEGYLYSKSGSGTYVADTLPRTFHRDPGTDESLEADRLLSSRGAEITRRVTGLAKAGGAFVPGVADTEFFPFHIWRRLQNRYLKRNHAELTGYVEHGGYRPLRDALSAYLYTSRAVRCSPQQVIITMGTHQSLDLIAKLLTDPGDAALIESPCHWGAPVVLSAAGLECRPLHLDLEGARIPEAGVAEGSRLAFVTPSHQYPTGSIMTLQRRRDWLSFAEAQNLWLIEDDYDSEFRYDIDPLPSMQGLGNKNRVIYLGTFSKVTFPGLRLSYLVVPEALADAFSKGMTQLYRPGFLTLQAAMADFILEGHFATHIRRMRAVYAQRRSRLQSALDAYFGGDIQYSPGQAGLHLAVKIGPEGTARKMINAAVDHGLTLRGSYALDPRAGDDNLLVLGYGGIRDAEVEGAVRRLRCLYGAVR
ncbi:PLP-dependent aminotransferase family protein [Pseudomonas taiwanensis]|uniref:MocR-like pyridoxine biosynthesis transcription factor PdxR n=1 Tax=Pseudomonas taiwanensis TaxID=470150 RepID=UPI0016454D86|nr:PLP-dependent aminotransferase family protein [Pseudomonas taiwanensis]MBC3489423.1 PLP-dependent aminotransferase family protein [Pseudomonas taiwanensis]